MAPDWRAASCWSLLLVCVAATASLALPEIDYNNPVRSAAEDEVTNLPDLSFKPNFKHFSGYVRADKQSDRFLHYWFVESQSEPANDPLVLWLNGGPGCSSLLGLLTELGPFRVAANNSVVENPFAWNKRANVVFLESPSGVGFSYAARGAKEEDDDTTAKQNHAALRSFLDKFPQYKKNPLYLTGESYGGVYLPTLGVLVDEDAELNLKGIAIGNGYLDANKLAESLVYFSYFHGLVGRSTWEGISKHCCNGQAPARGQCQIVSPDRSEKCSQFVSKATDDIVNSGVNPYNLYDQCSNGSQNRLLDSKRNSRNFLSYRETFDKRLILSAFKLNKTQATREAYSKKQLNRLPVSRPMQSLSKLGNDPPCTDDSVTVDYLNQAHVKRALHIPEKLTTPFTTCSDTLVYRMIYPGQLGGLAPQMRKLISSKRNLTLLVYNGDVDLMCNFFGDEWFVDDLNREVIRDYSAWQTNGQVSGFAKYYKGIAYFTVKGSGHMVPTDRPAEALNMFGQFLDGLNPNETN